MKQFSRRIQGIHEYVFARLSQKKLAVEQQTSKKVLDLSAGIPTYPPSNKYVSKLKELCEDPKTYLYPGYKPIPEFSQGLISWYKQNYQVNLEHDQLMVLHGGKDGISHIFPVLADENDEILIPDPGYPGFWGPTSIFGGKVVPYTLDESDAFKINLEQLDKKLTAKTKFVIVNFPSNPTGQTIDLQELQKIIDWARERDIWVVYDNAYADINFDGYVAPSILQARGSVDVAIEVGSFSKGFSFSGLRIGWIAGNPEIISQFYKIKTQIDSGVPYIFQKLAGYALSEFDREWHKQMIDFYQRQKNLLLEKFVQLGLTPPYIPRAGLYLWLKIPDTFADSMEYTEYLLQEKQVLVTPGLAFGENGKKFVRVCFSVNLDNIDQYL